MISFYLYILIIKNKIGYWSNSSQHYCSNNKNYHEIIPNLYIGNINSAKDKSFIKNKKINVIINCTNSIPNYFQFNTDIEYHRLSVDDSLLDKDIEIMSVALPKYVKIINDALLQKKSVLVHCYAGRQRSACLIAAYLIYKYKYSIDEAYQFIILKRKEAFHYGRSFNFHRSLVNYKKNINK